MAFMAQLLHQLAQEGIFGAKHDGFSAFQLFARSRPR